MSKLSDLDTLIPQYAADKEWEKAFSDHVKKENAKIKEIMMDFVVPNYTAGDYVATCSVTTRETMNEETLISLFSSVPSFVAVAEEFGIVKERPYIDFDALEKALYQDKLSQEQILEMDKAKEVKEVTTLRIKKAKKKEKKD